jgi:hypothetical protein
MDEILICMNKKNEKSKRRVAFLTTLDKDRLSTAQNDISLAY